MRRILGVVISIMVGAQAYGQSSILIDGDFGDWNRSQIIAEDYSDNHPSLIGIDRLWASGDNEYFYCRFDLTEEIDLDSYNEIALYLDTDDNPNTGFKTNGIGAEVTYFFGLQYGFINYEGQTYSIDHVDLALAVLPTFTSNSIELAMKRELKIDGKTLNMGDQIKVFIHNDDIFEDKIPNRPGGIAVNFTNEESAVVPYDFDKVNSNDLRVISYNVENDGLFSGTTRVAQERIIKALNPDIIAFQEIYNNSNIDVENLMEDYFPGTNWKALKAGPDVIVATRHRTVAVDWIAGNGAFLLEIGSAREPLIVLNAHLPCCDNDIQRQDEIDEIMKAFKDSKIGDLAYDVDPNTPIIFTGDFNLVGASQNYTSMITGDIFDEFTYGEDQMPDWDNSYLEDCRPMQTGFPFAYTWRNDFSDFFPGKLDFMLYTGSHLKLNNSFVFNTTGIDQASLTQRGLFFNDSYAASDHLPIVSDFSMESTNPPALSATATLVQEPICFGEASAIVEISASGGTPPYSYGLDNINFQKDYFFDMLTGGSYSFHIKDSNGQIFDTGIIVINQPVELNFTVSFTGDQIMITGLGGEAPYEYALDGSTYQASNAFDVNQNDNIDIFIRDSKGCTYMRNYTVNVDEDNDGYNVLEDCDDENPNINPGATEIVNNDIDEDCDGVAQMIDEDNDGFNSDEDCDDNNANVNPDETEIPNNDVDEDCDGVAQVIDMDNDGFNSDEDCDDANANVNPNATEIPNNDVDEDCDGVAQMIDEDNDGFNSDEDCDDNDADINPDATEIPNNGVDEDCDGFDSIVDQDNDGYNSDEDCDDQDANINPGATEIPNNATDEDCDGIAQVIDEDNDGFNSDEDCDDNNASVNPNATEIPNNNIDEDCDGIAQMIDEDNDGFNSDEDCDDTNADINPDATEIPNNGIDEDCDGLDSVIDQDNDGFNSDEDCDDNNADINPDATEIANNNIDEDCDGIALIIDEDNDGFNSDEDCDDANANVNPNATEIPNNNIDEDCDGVAQMIDEDNDGFNSDEDCDDNNADVNPDATEIANNDIDEDCDGDALIIDEDNDGFNSDEDCDDNNEDVNPDAIEIANNGLDDDCDGTEWILSNTNELSLGKIAIYPNPARDYIELDFQNVFDFNLKIYDSRGALLLDKYNSKFIDLSHIDAGVYFISIQNIDSMAKVYKRLVISK